ncbi:MAG: four helix bundle protein [Bacteroidota bacterium]|nr:four helix bundle protein [Bacteroidota bacterium]
MPTIKKFEDIEIWQQARELCKEIMTITKFQSFEKDYSLKEQLRRSSGSIMDNIAEGFERQGNREFQQFLYIAKGSNGEVRSQLYRALDYGYIDMETFSRINLLSNKVGVKIHNLIDYLAKSNIKGMKFKKVQND